MTEPKIVKRYANRKLYDTDRSCYVTLDDIGLMIKAGDEVRVIDNKSGEDLTSVTLAQIIFEAEKRNSFMPLGLLRELIQNKGEVITSAYRESVDIVQSRATDIKDNIEGVIRKSEQGARSQFDSVQKAIDELQVSVEGGIKGGVTAVGRELDSMRKRLADLEQRLGGGSVDD